MAKPFRFDFLLQLALDKREEAVRSMGDARRRLESAQQKLQQIEQYRSDYQQRLTDSGKRGMAVHQWNDFRLFLDKLDTAVTQQTAEINRLAAQLEQYRQHWLACEKEVKAYEALQERHVALEVKRELRSDQKLTDEAAQKSGQRRREEQ